MLEMYTNGFAYDLQQRLQPYGNIPVVWGITFEEFNVKAGTGEIPLPCVYFHSDSVTMMSDQRTFTSLTPQNQWIQRPFDFNFFSFGYVPLVAVYGFDENVVDNIFQILKSIYDNGLTLLFQNPYIPSERVPITLKSGKTIELGQGTILTCKGMMLTEGETVVPYFFDQNDLSLIGKDHQTEYNLLLVALTCAIEIRDMNIADPNMAQQMRMYYLNRMNQICDLLKIPTHDVNIPNACDQPREASALFAISQMMLEDDELSAGDAYTFYQMDVYDKPVQPDPNDKSFKGKLKRWKSGAKEMFTSDEFIDALADRMEEGGVASREGTLAAINLIKTGSQFLKRK